MKPVAGQSPAIGFTSIFYYERLAQIALDKIDTSLYYIVVHSK